MLWHFFPASLHCHPLCRQFHFFTNNVSKDTFMVIRADGYKIFPGLGVVVLFQSNGFAVMLVYCVHLAHCGTEIEIPCGTYGWFGIFVTINISYSRAEGKKKQELK